MIRFSRADNKIWHYVTLPSLLSFYLVISVNSEGSSVSWDRGFLPERLHLLWVWSENIETWCLYSLHDHKEMHLTSFYTEMCFSRRVTSLILLTGHMTTFILYVYINISALYVCFLLLVVIVLGVWCSSLDAQRTCGSEKPALPDHPSPSVLFLFFPLSFPHHFPPPDSWAALPYFLCHCCTNHKVWRLRIRTGCLFCFFKKKKIGSIKKENRERERQRENWHSEGVCLCCTPVTHLALFLYL